MRAAPVIGVLAGELSGDALGAGLMQALRERYPDARFLGVGGPAMQRFGLESLADLEILSVNGFIEPVKRFPALLRLLLDLERSFAEAQIDVFVGVDFNVFNLLLERRLRRRGFATVHYVSPSVYAWRRGRVRTVARAARLLLTLYPFEPPLYRGQPLSVVYVGHPLADRIAPDAGSADAQRVARQALGVAPEATCLGLLPGSRGSELEYHLPLFLAAAEEVDAALGAVTWVLPCPRRSLRSQIDRALSEHPDLSVIVDDGTAQRALTAADGAFIKSGTSTLEAMLLRRPMVVCYRLGAATYRVLTLLVRVRTFALPNILAGRPLVPELIQDAATPLTLARALLAELEQAQSRDDYFAPFDELHTLLRRDASKQAAIAISTQILEPH
ncbi:MAG: lipid-A-disaccharide synthase [Pseudomonadota bacterium]